MTDAQVEAALDEREVDLVARAMFEEDKSRWVEPDYSQHEFVLRGFAKCAIRALTAAREADSWALPVHLLPDGWVICSLSRNDERWGCYLAHDADEFSCYEEADGFGPTPRAAFIAAIEAAKG